MTSTTINKDYYSKVKDILGDIQNYEDGTYDFTTRAVVNYEKGYQVAFKTESRNYQDYYSDHEYDNIVYKIAALLGVNAQIEVYLHIPEISYYIENFQLALAMAALFNQQTIWDWSQSDVIYNTLNQLKYF